MIFSFDLVFSQGETLCREALVAATLGKNLDDLNLNLQKASEMGLVGPEVDRAKATQKELHISSVNLKALRWDAIAILIGCWLVNLGEYMMKLLW